ncbi:MAG TPA: hypothetical protein VEU11_01635 [Terriglobales bacterium]|jgi:hypothetical protein|nr:hypothetical protein [Terriglobales bacterium]
MSSDILSKAFTTTRALELEYRKLSVLRESGSEVELSPVIEEDGDRPLIAELACFADAIWL